MFTPHKNRIIKQVEVDTDFSNLIQIFFFQDQVESRYHELTGLDFLDFWMQSIYAYAITNDQISDESRPQLSPPMFIVGTHRESADINPDQEQRMRIVSTFRYDRLCYRYVSARRS